MASINKKTRTVYNLELDEEEMKVLANLLYNTQMGMTGPAAVASRIYKEVDKYIYIDEYDRAGRENFIEVNGELHWG